LCRIVHGSWCRGCVDNDEASEISQL
jgi:hypothetical protein